VADDEFFDGVTRYRRGSKRGWRNAAQRIVPSEAKYSRVARGGPYGPRISGTIRITTTSTGLRTEVTLLSVSRIRAETFVDRSATEVFERLS